ncbi:MAG: HmuY family protein [Gemmatimonadota bacterium]|nr:HmuY family protein [Gemmatimonadota bacterium]
MQTPRGPRAARRGARGSAAPLPLLIGFGVFVVAMGYLLAASFTRRAAPTFAPAVAARGDTLTIDATDGKAWRYVSLARGRVLSGTDTGRWDIGVRRYNLIANGDVVDLGPARFDTVGGLNGTPEPGMSTVGRWYRYSLLTHLLESTDHVYVVRTTVGRLFKLKIVSYYCPGLAAGCMTIQYAALSPE